MQKYRRFLKRPKKSNNDVGIGKGAKKGKTGVLGR